MRRGHRRGGAVGAFLATALAAVLFGLPAAGQTTAPRCRSLTDSAERLRCYDEEAAFSPAATILKELECERSPKPAEALRLLVSRNAISSFAFDVADGLNYFLLQKPEVIDGLSVIGVFGFDESGGFSFLRGSGPSPGRVFGVVTQEPLGKIDRWRLAHSPGIMFDTTSSNLKSAKDLACWK